MTYESRDACPWYQSGDLDEEEWAARATETRGASTMELHQIPASILERVATESIALYREFLAFGADPDRAAVKAVAAVVEGCGGMRERRDEPRET